MEVVVKIATLPLNYNLMYRTTAHYLTAGESGGRKGSLSKPSAASYTIKISVWFDTVIPQIFNYKFSNFQAAKLQFSHIHMRSLRQNISISLIRWSRRIYLMCESRFCDGKLGHVSYCRKYTIAKFSINTRDLYNLSSSTYCGWGSQRSWSGQLRTARHEQQARPLAHFCQRRPLEGRWGRNSNGAATTHRVARAANEDLRFCLYTEYNTPQQ